MSDKVAIIVIPSIAFVLSKGQIWHNKRSGTISRILFTRRLKTADAATIHLVPVSPPGSSGLPGSIAPSLKGWSIEPGELSSPI
ncbi:MAG TPA: hypothetical protein PLS31_05465 [Candidatus Sumerlaeota bacterium]|nr:hypothetical protein [Candidatus Sumerlaeota bacterium]